MAKSPRQEGEEEEEEDNNSEKDGVLFLAHPVGECLRVDDVLQ